MQSLLNDDSQQESSDDEVVGFLISTSIGDKWVVPFQLFNANVRLYQSTADNAQDVLLIESWCWAIEVVFPISLIIINELRKKSSDETIRSLFLVDPWTKLL